MDELKQLTGAKTFAEAIDAAIKDTYGENSRFILMNHDLIEALKELALMVEDEEGYNSDIKKFFIMTAKYLKKCLLAANIETAEKLGEYFDSEELRREAVRIALRNIRRDLAKKPVRRGAGVEAR